MDVGRSVVSRGRTSRGRAGRSSLRFGQDGRLRRRSWAHRSPARRQPGPDRTRWSGRARLIGQPCRAASARGIEVPEFRGCSPGTARHVAPGVCARASRDPRQRSATGAVATTRVGQRIAARASAALLKIRRRRQVRNSQDKDAPRSMQPMTLDGANRLPKSSRASRPCCLGCSSRCSPVRPHSRALCRDAAAGGALIDR